MTIGYIGVPVTVDPDQIAQQALSDLITNVPGWIPREGNLDVAIIEEMANIGAETATVASTVPDDIFRYFGGLIGVTPQAGVQAQILTHWNLTAAPSSTITYPAGTIAGFAYNGTAYQFELAADLVIPMGTTDEFNVLMEALSVGVAYNLDLVSGLNPLATYMGLLTADPLIGFIQITDTSATNSTLLEGVDPETDASYLDRLTAELQLLAPRPITPGDYSTFSRNVTGVQRALAIDAYNPFLNLLSEADANFTELTASPVNWTTFGNGSATLPVLTKQGTSPNAYAQVATTALSATSTVNAATTVGQATLVLTAATSFVSTTTSANNPTFLLVSGATSEVVQCTVAAASNGTTQSLTLGSPMRYTHAASDTVAILQGIYRSSPYPAAFPSPAASLYANTPYYQVSSCVGNVSGTIAAMPILVCVATYADNSTAVFSSMPSSATWTDINHSPGVLGTTHTGLRWLNAYVSSLNPVSGDGVAPLNPNSALYAGITQEIVAIQPFVCFALPGSSEIAKVVYNQIRETDIDVSLNGVDSQSTTTSLYNHVPDAQLSQYALTDASTGSWTFTNGNSSALPGFGLKFTGGGASTASSPIFNVSNQLQNLGVPTTSAPKYFTLIAKIDGSALTAYAGSGSNAVTLQVVSITGASTAAVVAAAVLPTANANTGFVYVPFTLSNATVNNRDLQVQLVFGSGLVLPANASVIVSQISVLVAPTSSGLTTPPANYSVMTNWGTGGLYTGPAVFNSPRCVAVAPCDANGLPVTSAISNNLLNYLQGSREANFNINILTPNYVPINVTWSAIAQPGYDPVGLGVAVDSIIYDLLSPASWGGGNSTPPSWNGTQTVLQSYDVAAVIGQMPGIGSVTSVGLTQGTATSCVIPVGGIVVTGTNLATVTCSSPHEYFNGEIVSITGTGTAQTDLTSAVITVVSPLIFTYPVVGATNASYTGSVVPAPQASVALTGAAPLPIGNVVSGTVTQNPVDALVGAL